MAVQAGVTRLFPHTTSLHAPPRTHYVTACTIWFTFTTGGCAHFLFVTPAAPLHSYCSTIALFPHAVPLCCTYLLSPYLARFNERARLCHSAHGLPVRAPCGRTILWFRWRFLFSPFSARAATSHKFRAPPPLCRAIFMVVLRTPSALSLCRGYFNTLLPPQ